MRSIQTHDWLEEYADEVLTFRAWTVKQRIPFKWAMIRAMRGYMRHGRQSKGGAHAKPVESVDGTRSWDSVAEVCRDLRVSKRAVQRALEGRKTPYKYAGCTKRSGQYYVRGIAIRWAEAKRPDPGE